MTRTEFNKIAAARFSAMAGITLEAGMINAKEGIFVSLIAEGNESARLSKLPNVQGIEYDAELDETFAYVKLS